MPSNVYKAQVVLTGVSGDPEDVYVNNFHFQEASGTIDVSGAEVIAGALDEFYGLPVNPGPTSVSQYISDDVSRIIKPQVKVYDAIVGGSPIWDSELLSFDAALMTSNLPTEVAAALSFSASLVNIPESVPQPPDGPEGDLRPASRRRGRVYLGPLTPGAITDAGMLDTANFAAVCVAAGARLRDDSLLASNGIDWVVFSETEQLARPVTAVWMNNAPDIQRRRGRKPSITVGPS